MPIDEVWGEYGPGPDPGDDCLIRGKVLTMDSENPIPGIKVSVKDLQTHGYTSATGNFYIYVPKQESYKLKFEDVDGAENGLYKLQKKKIMLEETSSSIMVFLDEENAD